MTSPIHFGCNSVASKLHRAPLGSSVPITPGGTLPLDLILSEYRETLSSARETMSMSLMGVSCVSLFQSPIFTSKDKLTAVEIKLPVSYAYSLYP